MSSNAPKKKPSLDTDAGILTRGSEPFRKMRFWLVAVYVLLISATIALAFYGIREAKTWTDAVIYGVEVLILSIGTLAWRHELVIQPTAMEILCEQYRQLYLNGFTVYDFMNLEVQKRLEHYLGKTLSYEAATLTMIALRGHHQSRFIIGEVFYPEDQMFHWHGWVETRMFGTWWTIDPMLNEEFIATRARHNHRRYTQYSRIIGYDEFWGLGLPIELYEHLVRPETSYLLHELYLFHIMNYSVQIMELEIEGRRRLDGCKWNQSLVGIYGPPLTQRMILEFLAKRERRAPHRKTVRRGRRLAKDILN